MYHVNSVQKTQVVALTIQVESDDSSISDVIIADTDEIILKQSMGCTVEVKVDPVNDAAINECFNNMFGSGSRLTTMQLEMGNIVEEVKMYGVVASMEDPDHAVLLSLDMNFSNGSCHFRCVDKAYSFVALMNFILNHLGKWKLHG